MPPAARLSDPATHLCAPISPGAGSADVDIGFRPAWRALPIGMGAGVEGALTTMKELVDAASLDPGTTPVKLMKVNAGLSQDAAKAAANGSPGAPAAVSGGFASLMANNTTLTATYVAAAAVPGGEPAARTAYSMAIKAAAAAFAASAISSIAGMTDSHLCSQPAGPIPHGPGVVTKGSSTVLINHLPACREGDPIFEAAGGSNPIKTGEPSVLIGDDVGAPAADLPVDTSAIEAEALAQSTIAALVRAAAAAAPLIEICAPCSRLRDVVQGRKYSVRLRVVIDETGEPVAGVALDITLPDGTLETRITHADGRVEIDDLDSPGFYTVRCELRNARLLETFSFVAMGETPHTSCTPVEESRRRVHPSTGGVIATVEEHRVRSGDTLESLAQLCGLTWRQLALFNWNTSIPDEINRQLRDFVGCTKRTVDQQNYVFDSSDEPGIVYLPRLWMQTGLMTDVEETIRVRAPRTRLRRLIITLLDGGDRPRPSIPYRLLVGDRIYESRTNDRGQLDEFVPVQPSQGALEVDGRRIELHLNQLESVDEIPGVQKRLNNLGYRAGTGGTMNAQTAKALREFQHRHALDVTGEPNGPTRARLVEIYGH